jgi:hypothetical protein
MDGYSNSTFSMKRPEGQTRTHRLPPFPSTYIEPSSFKNDFQISRKYSLYIFLILIFVLLFIYSRPEANGNNYQRIIQSVNPLPTAQSNPVNVQPSPVSPLFGFNNYTEYTPGDLPLIISVAHGGHRFPEDVPTREKSSPSVVISNDINTLEVGKALVKRLAAEFGGRRAYFIINNLGRSKVDVNRPFEEGTEPNKTDPDELSISQQVWQDYHNFFKKAVEEIEEKYGRGLIIDLHGTFSLIYVCVNQFICCFFSLRFTILNIKGMHILKITLNLVTCYLVKR